MEQNLGFSLRTNKTLIRNISSIYHSEQKTSFDSPSRGVSERAVFKETPTDGWTVPHNLSKSGLSAYFTAHHRQSAERADSWWSLAQVS